MTQIPDWFSSTDDRAEEKINEIIDYLTARQELEDSRYKELTSRIDTITGNPLEMKGGKRCPEEDFGFEPKDQPKRWPQKGDLILRNTFHQELQKARERLLAEIIKDVNTMWIDELSRKEREDGATAIGYSRVVAYLSKKDQSELDQPDALTK